MRCQNCGSRDIDFQESGGQSVCVSCGTVLEENTLTASIEFQVQNAHRYFYIFKIFIIAQVL